MNFDWSDLAFGSKNKVNNLHAVFVPAPRDISTARFRQLVQTYLPKQNILLGFSKEQYVEGFEDQPQFRMLEEAKVRELIDRINQNAKTTHKIYTLSYFQRELSYVLQKLSFSNVILVRGSWKHTFHTLPAYYTLIEAKVPYTFVSPFTSTAEAQAYEKDIEVKLHTWLGMYMSETYTEAGMLDLSSKAAKLSFDYSFQTGVVVGKRTSPQSKKYSLLLGAFNKVVPYQTYAMHNGNSREEHFSPPHDLNYYDTVHAEMELLVWALYKKASLKDTTMFINLLPCPTCSRILSQTELSEIVYTIDHSDGYAIKMLEAAGKKVRRLIP
nr:cytidine and deoxycytidylate deaminase zinc-binding region [uncultured bacterium]